MNIKSSVAALLGAAVLVTAVVPALPASAQDSHRQKTKNAWRNTAIGAGALGILGLATHNNTLTAVGAAGSLYSLSRYEHDRKSQSRSDREHARLWGRSSFTHNGHHYVRKTVHRNGHTYYQFVRG